MRYNFKNKLMYNIVLGIAQLVERWTVDVNGFPLVTGSIPVPEIP